MLCSSSVRCGTRGGRITVTHLSEWRDARLKQVSAGTVLREIGLLSDTVELARREWRWIEVNPMRDVRKPRTPDHRQITLTRQQVQTMLIEMGYSPLQPARSVSQATAVGMLVAWDVPLTAKAMAVIERMRVALRGKLQPVFITDFMRSSFILRFSGAQIEVCMDEGWIHRATRRQAICEVELELKSATAQALFALVLALFEIVPFDIEVVNKGFRLLDENFAESSSMCTRPKLDAQQGVEAKLQSLMWAYLLHLQKNLRGIHDMQSPTFLAQVQLALRRLNVLLRVIAKLSGDTRWRALQMQLACLQGDALDEVALQRVMLKIPSVMASERDFCAVKPQPLPSALRAYLA